MRYLLETGMRNVVLILLAMVVVGLAGACNGPPDPTDPMMPDPMMPDNPPGVAPLDSSVVLR